MLIYTALGDSITAGESASAPSLAYPNLVAQIMKRNGVATVVNVLAQPGWTSTALDDAVFANSAQVLQISRAVSIWVGGDNLAYAGLNILGGAPRSSIDHALKRYATDLAALISLIHRVSSARVIVCTQYNPFPNTPLAAQAINVLNQVTTGVAARTNVMVAPVHSWFAGRQAQLIAGYRSGLLRDAMRSSQLPIHPNNAGHRVIAEGMAPLIS